MPKRKQEKKIEIKYEYAGDTEENRQRMEKAYDLLFDATLKDKIDLPQKK